jgi:hypothetical protein
MEQRPMQKINVGDIDRELLGHFFLSNYWGVPSPLEQTAAVNPFDAAIPQEKQAEIRQLVEVIRTRHPDHNYGVWLLVDFWRSCEGSQIPAALAVGIADADAGEIYAHGDGSDVIDFRIVNAFGMLRAPGESARAPSPSD